MILRSALLLSSSVLLSVFAIGCGDDSATTSGTNTTSGAGECAPGDGCPTVTSDCVAFVDNAASESFALRISHLSLTKPAALVDPTVTNLLGKGVNLNYPQCTAETGDPLFTGDGSFNWILQFDKATGKLTTGGAVLEADPTKGYCFLQDEINGFDVAPLVADAPIGADGSFAIAEARNVTVPVYATPTDPNSVILLPLRGVTIHDAKVSADNNCIGQLNPNLDPNNLCLAGPDAPQYVDAAQLDGYVTLEEADMVKVPVLGDLSLCALIAKDAEFKDGKNCKRGGDGKVLFKGDWCAGAENEKGTPGGCQDSVQLAGSFAANAVKLRTDCP